jgi:ATP-dependent DNA helicase Q1
MELRARIQDLDDEVGGCYADIETIQNRIQECLTEKQKLVTQLEKASMKRSDTTIKTANPKGKGETVGNVNFLTQSFDWTGGLRARMKSVFGIKDFRLCQEGLVPLLYTARILV